jgi:hypothetical protein
MKKVLRIVLIVLAVLAGLGTVAYFIADKPVPDARPGPKAEALADRMLAWAKADAWEDTPVLRFSFMGQHHYLWDKARDRVEVRWSNKRVLLHTPTRRGVAWKDSQRVDSAHSARLVEKALGYFFNDSYWCNPVVKVRDPGVERGYVELEGPHEGLLVTFTQGGVTPGDRYLWIIDEQGRPVAWRMWVQIIPIGGLKTSWDNWQRLQTGARVAGRRSMGPVKIEVEPIRAYTSLQAAGAKMLFAPLEISPRPGADGQ